MSSQHDQTNQAGCFPEAAHTPRLLIHQAHSHRTSFDESFHAVLYPTSNSQLFYLTQHSRSSENFAFFVKPSLKLEDMKKSPLANFFL